MNNATPAAAAVNLTAFQKPFNLLLLKIQKKAADNCSVCVFPRLLMPLQFLPSYGTGESLPSLPDQIISS